MENSVPANRLHRANARPLRPGGRFVLYWMTATRRPLDNFALQRAVSWAVELNRPLVVLEALRCDYPWASDRLHSFVLQGMAAQRQHFAGRDLLYHPYVEPRVGDGRGLLGALGEQACVVVTDTYPAFFLPRMVARAAATLAVRLEQVDSCGVLPLSLNEREFTSAYAFRRFLQRELPAHLACFPRRDPTAALGLPRLTALPEAIGRRWPAASPELLGGAAGALAALPIDHDVPPTTGGGWRAALHRWHDFFERRLAVYHEQRNPPEAEGSSGLSPYLHLGQISPHRVLGDLFDREGWSLDRTAPSATGARSGWWGLSAPAEAFVDQLVTWRELGFNCCVCRDDYARYDSLPDWARRTLAAHAADPRPVVYDREQLRRAMTHDPLWNAAQRQLLREGRMHNYLRMLWGKKILEWSPSPRDALSTMIELNNRYALDGRDPNSYSGIFWVLGRYDRAWGPERPIFGKVRYMSSKNTARKYPVRGYIERYAPSDR